MNVQSAEQKIYCRLCLCRCNVSFDMNYGSPNVKQKIDVCFPDLDLTLVESPRICLECFISLTHTYLLLIRYDYCQKTINSYLSSDTDFKKPIRLEQVLQDKQLTPKDFKHECIVFRLKDQIENVMMNMIEMELKNADCDEPDAEEAVNSLMRAIDVQREGMQQIEVPEVKSEDELEELEIKVEPEEPIVDFFMKDAGTDEAVFTCEMCEMAFQSNSGLQEHRSGHRNEKQVMCSFCQKSFTYKHRLKEHLRMHLKEKPYSCGKCRKTFKHRSSFNRHRGKCNSDDDLDE